MAKLLGRMSVHVDNSGDISNLHLSLTHARDCFRQLTYEHSFNSTTTLKENIISSLIFRRL